MKWHISTSGLKSDVIVVFLDFLSESEISAIRPQIRLYCIFFIAHGRPYFHFRSKIWRRHRVTRPQFPLGLIRENFRVPGVWLLVLLTKTNA